MLGPIVLALALTSAGPTLPGAIQDTPEQPWPPSGVSRLGEGVTPPRIVKESKPRYPAEARRAKIQGNVVMEAVVLADGTVGDVRVTKSLDREFGVDDEAVRTLKTWRFTPGKKDGAAVPVLVEVEMTFTVRDNHPRPGV